MMSTKNHMRDNPKKVRLLDLDETMNELKKEVWWTDSEKASIRNFLSRQKRVDAVEVVHAHWDEWWPGDCALIMTGEEMLYQCSACTAKYSNVEGFRYCPHCGAFMDLERGYDK